MYETEKVPIKRGERAAGIFLSALIVVLGVILFLEGFADKDLRGQLWPARFR